MNTKATSITVQEVADRLGVHYMTAYKYVRTGQLPATKIGRSWAVETDDLEAFTSSDEPTGQEGRVDRTGRLQDRMLAGDEGGAWAVINQAMASGMTPHEVHLELLAPVMSSVGDQWETGALSVSDEHVATAVALRLVGRLGQRMRPRGQQRSAIVVVGGAPGEMHALPVAIAADLLRDEGHRVIELGANAPADSWAEMALMRPGALAICATVTGQDHALKAAVDAARAVDSGVPVLVGGAGVRDEEHARELGADSWSGQTAADLLRTVQGALTAGQ